MDKNKKRSKTVPMMALGLVVWLVVVAQEDLKETGSQCCTFWMKPSSRERMHQTLIS